MNQSEGATREMQMVAEGLYLGDGAYVKEEGIFVVVYTHNGYHATNSVYLEPEVEAALYEYLKKRREGVANEPE